MKTCRQKICGKQNIDEEEEKTFNIYLGFLRIMADVVGLKHACVTLFKLLMNVKAFDVIKANVNNDLSTDI